MEDIEQYINKIKNNEKLYLQHILEDCKNSDLSTKIKDILSYLRLSKIKPEIQNDLKLDTSKIEKYLYQRPWKQLSKSQKFKLNEFFKKSLINTNNENLENIKFLIIKDFNNNKLNSAKKVKYDSLSSNILSIVLEYNKDKQNICIINHRYLHILVHF